jgi:hypothetical protein
MVIRMPRRPRSTKASRSQISDLRGASRLAIEATNGVADVVEAMQHGIGAGPAVLGRPVDAPVRLFTAPIYGSIRRVARAVGHGIDATLGLLEPLVAPLLGSRTPGPRREALIPC